MANRLREERLKNNLTLSELSKKLTAKNIKISSDGLAKYERGDREPKLATWKKLADYFDVPVTELMGVDDYMKSFVDSMVLKSKDNISNLADDVRKNNDRMLSSQLDRINKTNLHEMESSTLAVAIEMVMDLYEKYEFNDNKTEDVTLILRALNFMINNSVDNDDDYQNTIDDFTKLVNNLKEQNKKASD